MKSIITLALGCTLISCSSSHTDTNETALEDTTQYTQQLVIGDPLDCGFNHQLMFPIGTSYRPEVIEPSEMADGFIAGLSDVTYSFTINSSANAYDKLADLEYINNNGEDYDITDILFYDIESGESYPLVGEQDTLHILSFAIHKEFDNPLIFYRVVKEDYHCDTLYNALDPIMLYVSPLNGDTMIQVTPEGEQFVDYFYYPEQQKILAKTRVDADRDSLFSVIDETNFVEIDLNQPSRGKPLFSTDLKEQLKGKLN